MKPFSGEGEPGSLGMIYGSYENGHQNQLTRSEGSQGLAEVFGSQVFSDFVHATSQILVSEEGFDSTTAKPLFGPLLERGGVDPKNVIFSNFWSFKMEKTSDFTQNFRYST